MAEKRVIVLLLQNFCFICVFFVDFFAIVSKLNDWKILFCFQNFSLNIENKYGKNYTYRVTLFYNKHRKCQNMNCPINHSFISFYSVFCLFKPIFSFSLSVFQLFFDMYFCSSRTNSWFRTVFGLKVVEWNTALTKHL